MPQAVQLFKEPRVVVDALERVGAQLEVSADPRSSCLYHVSCHRVVNSGIDSLQGHRGTVPGAAARVIGVEGVDDALQALIATGVRLSFTSQSERVRKGGNQSLEVGIEVGDSVGTRSAFALVVSEIGK